MECLYSHDSVAEASWRLAVVERRLKARHAGTWEAGPAQSLGEGASWCALLHECRTSLCPLPSPTLDDACIALYLPVVVGTSRHLGRPLYARRRGRQRTQGSEDAFIIGQQSRGRMGEPAAVDQSASSTEQSPRDRPTDPSTAPTSVCQVVTLKLQSITINTPLLYPPIHPYFGSVLSGPTVPPSDTAVGHGDKLLYMR